MKRDHSNILQNTRFQGSPSYVRVYRYPDFSGPGAAVANKSFYKADKVELIWNNKGEFPVPDLDNLS